VWESVRMNTHIPKWTPMLGVGVPVDSQNFRAQLQRVEEFFISLKSYWSLDVQMGLHNPFGHLQHKLWPKERSGVKLAVWLPTTESRESTWFLCVQVTCDRPLESSWRGLQLRFRPHPDRRCTQEVIVSQSCGTPIWESRDKKPFGCHSCAEVQSILYGGRWWLPPSPGRDESCESEVIRGSS
jgi:hypothetical protein